MNPQTRFTKLDAAGTPLPAGATNHVFLVDNALGVMHQVNDLSDPKPWKKAGEACRAARTLGFDDWRLPTPQEELALIDYTRFGPAVDPALLPNAKTGGVWTNTPVASAPRVCAWVVGFYDGFVYILLPYSRFRVRAVRSCVPASQ